MSEEPPDIDKQIEEVMRDDASRGRNRAPARSRRKKDLNALARELDKAMTAKNERGFSDALRKAGIADGSERWQAAWKAYRDHWK